MCRLLHSDESRKFLIADFISYNLSKSGLLSLVNLVSFMMMPPLVFVLKKEAGLIFGLF